MRWAISFVLLVHGLIHLMGFAKAFGLAELAALTQPISRPLGLVWLLAALLYVATVALWLSGVRNWWMLGAVAIVVSQTVLFTSWSDARFGTLGNVVALVAVVLAAALEGPTSLSSEMRREVERGLALVKAMPATPIAAADLERLPAPVRRYLEVTGALQLPRPTHLSARFRGRIRGDARAAWMPFVATQHSFFGGAGGPTRLFFMEARMMGLPVQVFHRYAAGEASMRVRVLGLVPMVSASGEVMTRAETVTLLNDACLLAPGAMLDRAIRWEEREGATRATYTNGAHTIAADVSFGDDGMIRDFVSDDRARIQGKTATACRWSTPVRAPRAYGPLRLAGSGEALYHPAEGSFAYLELTIDEVVVTPAASDRRSATAPASAVV